MICPKCGHEAKETDRFCVICATKLEPAAEIKAEVEASGVAVNAFEDEAEPTLGRVEDAAAVAQAQAEEVEKNAEAVIQHPAEKIEEVDLAVAEKTKAELKAEKKAAKQAEKEAKKAAKAENGEVEIEPAEANDTCGSSKPLTTWGFIWRIFLILIPIFNIIPLFVFAFASGINKNSRSFARAVLIYILIGVLLLLAAGTALFILFNGQDVIANVKGWLLSVLQ